MKRSKFITIFFNTLLLVFYANTVMASGGITVPREVKDTLVKITEILLLIATAVCIGKVIHIGILYVIGAAAEKSNAKQAILPWIIGTIVCFGAATIGSAIIDWFDTPSSVLDY